MFNKYTAGLGECTFLALRVVAGFMFALHGAQKLFGVLGGTVAKLTSLMGFAGVLEFAGGLLVVVGLWTRPVAFLLSGQMAVAYFMAHAPKGFVPLANGGELAVLYCFLWLYLFARGGGKYSLDGWLACRRPSNDGR